MNALRAYVRGFAGFGRDARMFLLTTLAVGSATAIYWIDFNLYLQALGIDRSGIGFMMALSQITGVLAVFPAVAISDRIGRRAVLAAAVALIAIAFGSFLSGSLPVLIVGIALYGVGSQAMGVVQIPYMAERTAPEHRTEFFSAMFALQSGTSIVATIAGGTFATQIAQSFGLGPSVGPYQVLLIAMFGLAAIGLLTVFLLADDRPGEGQRLAGGAGGGRFGLHISDRGRFFRLLLPGFLTSLGAGQLIPYLNIFIKGKFGLDLASVNVVFALTSLGTAVAILIQPALAKRFGKIGSIVLVQASSIPFLAVLGFSPILLTVVGAMAIRNSLMNAGSPIFDTFAMEHVSPAERGTVAGAMTLLWALGWSIAGPFYGVVQGVFGFTAGYAIDFLTCITLYTISTALLWTWFRDAEAAQRRQAAARERALPLGEVEAA